MVSKWQNVHFAQGLLCLMPHASWSFQLIPTSDSRLKGEAWVREGQKNELLGKDKPKGMWTLVFHWGDSPVSPRQPKLWRPSSSQTHLSYNFQKA